MKPNGVKFGGLKFGDLKLGDLKFWAKSDDSPDQDIERAKQSLKEKVDTVEALVQALTEAIRRGEPGDDRRNV